MKTHQIIPVATLLMVLANTTLATVHYVDANGTNAIAPYTSWATAATNIQDAILHSATDDTVLVTNGLYQYGSTANSRIALFTALTVQSVNGPAFTTIQGYQVPGTTNGSSAVRCAYLFSGATLSGFTLTGGATQAAAYGGGIYCTATNCFVTNCVIAGNAAPYAAGVFGGTLNNCVIKGNTAAYTGGGAQQSTLVNCILIGNSAPTINIGNGGGAYYSTLVNCLLTRNFSGYVGGAAGFCNLINCTVVNNSTAAYAGSLLNGTAKNSIVYYNYNYYTNAETGSGLTFSNCCVSFPVSPSFGANNFTNPPMFVNLTAGDYHLNAASPCINTGNNSFITNSTDLDGNPRIVGGIVDLGAYEFQSPVHYVKATLFGATPVSPFTNWITAATNIQDAIDAANAGDFIVVSNGVYNAGGRVVFGAMTNRVVIDKTLTVQSVNGPASTAIAGFRNANLPPTGIRCVYLTNGAALMGFTLTNGATLTTGDISQEQSGGGAWCAASGVVLSNCVFAGNAAARYGGGAFQGTVFNCAFTNNSASYGGGAASNALFNCTLARNSSLFQNLNYGGGGYACTLNNSLIVGNQSVAGGGYGAGAAFSVLFNCVVSNNVAGEGGGGVFMSVANDTLISSNRALYVGGGAFSNALNNCLLQRNLALNGGGSYNSALVDCTVVSNTATGDGGGMYGGGATNSIIYYNSGQTYPNFESDQSLIALDYCCTTPSPKPPGTGNMTNEPVFVNLAGGDFHLQSSSPCINAGNNSSVTGSTDLDGNPRIVGGTVDLGAYEFQSPDSVIFNVYLQAPTNNSSGITISWQSVNGVTYFIQRSEDLSAQAPFSTIQSNIVGQPGTTTYLDTSATNVGPYFYRVGVQQ